MADAQPGDGPIGQAVIVMFGRGGCHRDSAPVGRCPRAVAMCRGGDRSDVFFLKSMNSDVSVSEEGAGGGGWERGRRIFFFVDDYFLLHILAHFR